MKTFYVENSVGREITKTLNRFTRYHGWTAELQHDVHPQMQLRQLNGDAWWIEEVSKAGYVIITCDLAIVDNVDERDAVLRSKAKIIGFASAQYNRWDYLRALARHWLSIERHLSESPLVLKVWRGSKAPLRLI